MKNLSEIAKLIKGGMEKMHMSSTSGVNYFPNNYSNSRFGSSSLLSNQGLSGKTITTPTTIPTTIPTTTPSTIRTQIPTSTSTSTSTSTLFPPKSFTTDVSKQTSCSDSLNNEVSFDFYYIIIIVVLSLAITGICIWFFILKEPETKIIVKDKKSRREK